MNKIEVKTPVIINGIIITENIIAALDLMQFGGSFNMNINTKEFYPEMMKRYLTDCKEISFYLLQKQINNDSKTIDTTEMNVFSKLHWIHDLLEYFVIPEKLVEKLVSKNILAKNQQ